MGIWAFATNGVIALVSSAAGAYGAQWIVERQGSKRRALEEIRATNAAITLALFVSNIGLGLKRQHLMAMSQKYADDRNEFDRLVAARLPLDDLVMDWETLPLTELPFATLRNLIFGRIDAPGPAVSLGAMLEAAANHLQDALRQRNTLIEDTEKQPLTRAQRLVLYFGLTASER